MSARRLIVHVDGGARGNPGPAAIAAVVADPDGELVEERSESIGRATNNVAEYRALLLGIERARALGATEVELVGDSELIVRQVRGEYRVKDANLRGLHSQVREALAGAANTGSRTPTFAGSTARSQRSDSTAGRSAMFAAR